MTTTDIICICNYHGRGGAQNSAARLIRGFDQRGYSCRLVFLFEREPDVDFPGVVDINVIAAGKPKSVGQIFDFIRGLRRHVARPEAKAIIGFFPMSNVVGALFASRFIFPFRSARHLAIVPRFVGSIGNPVQHQSRFAGYLDKILGSTPLYSRIIAVSGAVRDSCAGYPRSYRNKLVVVHNAALALPAVEDSRDVCRSALCLRQGVPIIGMLGRLHPQKNIGFALDVLAKMQNRSIVLALAGDGPERASLEDRVRALGLDDRVVFIGMLAGDDVTRFYRAIDVFLFPSVFEGFGLTQVEAMSQDCPVVASDLPIMEEVGADGTIRLPFDANVWADAVERLLTDAEHRDALIGRGRARVQIFQDEDRMIDGYLNAAGLPPVKTTGAVFG